MTQQKRKLKENKIYYKALNKEFVKISLKLKNISSKFLNKDGDYKNFNEDYEVKIANFNSNQVRYDEKIKDLFEITNTQKVELTEYIAKLKINEKERKSLCKTILKLQNSMVEERKLNSELKQQLTILNELNIKFDETSKIILNQKIEIDNEKTKNNEQSILNNVRFKII